MQSPSLFPQAQVLNSPELGFCCILVLSGGLEGHPWMWDSWLCHSAVTPKE